TVPLASRDAGRLQRSLTGSSRHYVLASGGRVVDALPGLYGLPDFLAELTRAAEVAGRAANAPADEARAVLLRDYHAARLTELAAQWANDLAKTGVKPSVANRTSPPSAGKAPLPTAEFAAR